MFPFDHVSNNIVVMSIGPYLCWLSKMFFAYADHGLFVDMYHLCSLYLVFKSLKGLFYVGYFACVAFHFVDFTVT
jgi:hypothetical protein